MGTETSRKYLSKSQISNLEVILDYAHIHELIGYESARNVVSENEPCQNRAFEIHNDTRP